MHVSAFFTRSAAVPVLQSRDQPRPPPTKAAPGPIPADSSHSEARVIFVCSLCQSAQAGGLTRKEGVICLEAGKRYVWRREERRTNSVLGECGQSLEGQ